MGKIALHSNGLLSRFKPHSLQDYKLPGLPGRGALLARYGRHADNALYVCVLHLALTRRARLIQLGFVADLLKDLPHAIVMGDFNCEPGAPELRHLTEATELDDPVHGIKTWPSWQPQRMIDHILVTPSLRVEQAAVIHCACSDHLPIAMDISLPGGLDLHH